MPRKASGSDGTPIKASAKGGAKQASAAITADGDGGQILDSGQVTGTNATTAARGGSANKGVKRRRTSNNVNSNSGTEIYGSGTIVASNPFDDDHMPLSIANHNVGPPSNKIMMTMAPHPSQQSTMHPSLHQQANHISHSPHLQPPHHHHQQMPQHHQHHQQPMHHQHHHQPMYHHNNHHYHQQAMQQPMPLPPQQQPHAQIGTPPGHMPGVQHQGMHNHHAPQMMPQPGYGPPPPQHQSHPQVHHPQGLPPPQQHAPQHLHQQMPPQTHPTQNQMIGTPTPSQITGGHPGPTHSPYSTTIQQGGGPPMGGQPQPQTMAPQGAFPPPPAQAPVPLQQQQQPQQPQLIPPSHQHHQIDPMQQAPPLGPNQFGYCGKCQREVFKQEQHIICKAGCMSVFHISCSGLTQLACDLLMKESLAEWACDRCTSGARRVPYIKYKT